MYFGLNFVLAITQASASISAHCESEWPTDFEMQVYCIERQEEGYRDVKAFVSRYSLNLDEVGGKAGGYNVPELILLQCLEEWSANYEMAAYCISRQEEAARKLGKLGSVSHAASRSRSSSEKYELDPNSPLANGSPAGEVELAEQLLSDLGFFSAVPDSELTGKTVAAIFDYQTVYGLESSGKINDQLLQHLEATKARVVKAQEILKALDYYNGPINGVVDGRTKMAVYDFASDSNLQGTERFDDNLIEQLGRPRP